MKNTKFTSINNRLATIGYMVRKGDGFYVVSRTNYMHRFQCASLAEAERLADFLIQAPSAKIVWSNGAWKISA
jgi:hypothetical protein